MTTILSLLMINFICVYIIGYTEAPNNIASQIMSRLTNGKIKRVMLKKPWSCHLCMCWIISLIYMCFVIPWTFPGILLGITTAALNSFSTKYILYALQILDKFLTAVFIRLEKLCNKI